VLSGELLVSDVFCWVQRVSRGYCCIWGARRLGAVKARTRLSRGEKSGGCGSKLGAEGIALPADEGEHCKDPEGHR